jgi:hypothetical protein
MNATKKIAFNSGMARAAVGPPRVTATRVMVPTTSAVGARSTRYQRQPTRQIRSCPRSLRVAPFPNPTAVSTIATAEGTFEPIKRAMEVRGPEVAFGKMASGIQRAHVRP